MDEEEDFLDLEFDDGCYLTTWSLINMWYQKAKKLRKKQLRKKE